MFSERFDQALVFAHRLHRRQTRKTSGAPFIAHPLGVAALVIEDGGTEGEAIAALLHDTLEDQGRDFPGGPAALAIDIENRFGAHVRRLVESLTERCYPEELHIEDKRGRWRAHKRAYMEQVLHGGPEVCRISCADSLHNVRTLIRGYRGAGERIWDRFLTRDGDDQIWAYRTAAEMFQAAGVGPMADEMAARVADLASLRSTAPRTIESL